MITDMDTHATTAGVRDSATDNTASTGTAGVRMISSDRVEGTAVHGPDGTRIGNIHHLMIEKVSGRVAYAVMSFGGFLGMGKEFYPIPWESLRYDTGLDGYISDVTKEQVEGSPDYDRDRFNWEDEEWHRRTHEHYRGKLPPWTGYM